MKEVQPGVVLGFDANDRIVGIEFLNISSRLEPEELASIEFQTA